MSGIARRTLKQALLTPCADGHRSAVAVLDALSHAEQVHRAPVVLTWAERAALRDSIAGTNTAQFFARGRVLKALGPPTTDEIRVARINVADCFGLWLYHLGFTDDGSRAICQAVLRSGAMLVDIGVPVTASELLEATSFLPERTRSTLALVLDLGDPTASGARRPVFDGAASAAQAPLA